MKVSFGSSRGSAAAARRNDSVASSAEAFCGAGAARKNEPVQGFRGSPVCGELRAAGVAPCRFVTLTMKRHHVEIR
jgi:hypothetical protein